MSPMCGGRPVSPMRFQSRVGQSQGVVDHGFVRKRRNPSDPGVRTGRIEHFKIVNLIIIIRIIIIILGSCCDGGMERFPVGQ